MSELVNFNNMSDEELALLSEKALNVKIKRMEGKLSSLEVEQEKHNEEITEIKKYQNERDNINYGQQSALQYQKKKRVEYLWKSGGEFKKVLDTKGKLHARAWSELYRTFGVSSFRDVLTKDYDEAIAWMKTWRPQLF